MEVYKRHYLAGLVALRKESVDRNTMRRDFKSLGLLSLSARRAWIEIIWHKSQNKFKWSLSARRAWIEINGVLLASLSNSVALRKESVDRNWESRTRSGPGKWSLSARRAWIEMGMAV